MFSSLDNYSRNTLGHQIMKMSCKTDKWMLHVGIGQPDSVYPAFGLGAKQNENFSVRD